MIFLLYLEVWGKKIDIPLETKRQQISTEVFEEADGRIKKRSIERIFATSRIVVRIKYWQVAFENFEGINARLLYFVWCFDEYSVFIKTLHKATKSSNYIDCWKTKRFWRDKSTKKFQVRLQTRENCVRPSKNNILAIFTRRSQERQRNIKQRPGEGVIVKSGRPLFSGPMQQNHEKRFCS